MLLLHQSNNKGDNPFTSTILIMNKFPNLTNQELLEELRARIIAGTIEVEWEDTYGDSSTITNLATRIKGKKWCYLNFEKVLSQKSKKKK